MTQDEIAFLEQHKINFESVALGFTRNIQHDVLGRYEQIYRANLDPHFVLIYYCGACVFDMLKRLSDFYDRENSKPKPFVLPEEINAIPGAVMVEMDIPQPKKARPKKSK